jgi:hypothetical protein
VPRLSKEELNKDPKFKRPILTELFATADEIELMPLVREYVERLGSIQLQFRELSAERERAWELTLEAAILRYTSAHPTEAKSTTGLAVAPMNGNVAGGEPTYLHAGDYRPYLKLKNGHLVNFSKRYVKW